MEFAARAQACSRLRARYRYSKCRCPSHRTRCKRGAGTSRATVSEIQPPHRFRTRYRSLVLTSELLSGVSHCFTGVVEGDFRALDAEARGHALVGTLGGRGPLHTVRQVHGATMILVPDAPGLACEADALLATEPGTAVAVRVADCVPVLLATKGGVAAVHAGWRGTAADIVRGAVAALCAATGTVPADMRAAVGPSIRGCCYEVGDDVVQAVAAVTPGRAWVVGRNVDLAAANQAILDSLGVRSEVVGGCTRCNAAYWSHRRDGEAAGRQVGAIVVPRA